ncbi:MAG: 16S rRNA (cytidine(1402)-2'-O)-methyltransferase [Anaerolineales bacterium]
MKTLFLVATPIGNLEDISLRALKVLQSVTLIAAEDTRQTLKLLNHYQIEKPLISVYEQNESARIPFILETLKTGDVALVSDGGTPALNDPGFKLVNAVLEAGFNVTPIPGACAPIAALIASGLPTNQFLYLGFLPRQKNARIKFLQKILDHPYTLIFLEAPHRLLHTLRDMLEILGDRRIVIAREMTKIHEEFFRSQISRAIQYYQEQTPRGEITLIVEGLSQPEIFNDEEINAIIIDNIRAGKSAKDIIKIVTKQVGMPKKQIYQRIQQLLNQMR